MWSGTRLPELVVLVFLPPPCKCTSRSTRSEPQEKKNPNIQHIWRLTLKSADNVSMEIKCYGVDNEFSCCAFPSRKKNNPPLNDYTIQYSCVIDLKKNPHISISHPHSLMEVLTLRSQLFRARSASIDLKNQLNSWGIGKKIASNENSILWEEGRNSAFVGDAKMSVMRSITTQNYKRAFQWLIHSDKQMPIQWKQAIFHISRNSPISFSKWMPALINKCKMCSQCTSKYRKVLEVKT